MVNDGGFRKSVFLSFHSNRLMQLIFKTQENESHPWDAQTSIRSSNKLLWVTTDGKQEVQTGQRIVFRQVLNWRPTLGTVAVTCSVHLQNFQWEHKYLSVFPQWRDELWALQLSVLSSCSHSLNLHLLRHPSSSEHYGAYISYPRAPCDILRSNCERLDFIASNCSCIWFPCLTWSPVGL